MTKLVNFFENTFCSTLTEKQLRPGVVIYMRCDFTTPAKNKFLVVGYCQPDLLVMVINSKINKFILARTKLLRCQVLVPAVDHDFLKHDSYVNCVQTHTVFNLSSVCDAINADYARVYKGRLKNDCIRRVIEAVNISPSVEKRHINWITSSLSDVIQ